jgi:hypothetical protein
MMGTTSFTHPGNKLVKPLPAIKPPEYDSIPEELRAVDQWLVFKAPIECKKDGTRRYNKIPVNGSNGGPGSNTGAETWSSYEVCKAAQIKKPGTYKGVGYVLTHKAGITGIDLDHCIDAEGKIHPEAAKILERFQSYAEVSVSGDGIHIFVLGTLPEVTREVFTGVLPFNVEFFCDKCFLTVTGRFIDGYEYPVLPKQAELDAFHQEMKARAKEKDPEVSPAEGPTGTPDGDLPEGLRDVDEFEEKILSKLKQVGKRKKIKGKNGAVGYQYKVECPWGDEHSAGDKLAAVFFWESGVPGFKCLHSHCAKRKWKDLAGKFGLPTVSFKLMADKAIELLNKEWAVTLVSSRCAILHETINPVNGGADIQFFRREDFHSYLADMKCWVKADKKQADKNKKEGDEDKPVLVKTSASHLWFQDSRRRCYRGVVFDPTGKVAAGYYNLWRGFKVTPKHGNWALMRAHILQVICSGNQQWFDYLMAWIARITQHPGGERPGVAIVLRGGQGTGKGTFLRAIGEIFGVHFVHITNQSHLLGRFNDHMKDAILVFADESFFAGDKSALGTLKGLITEPTNFIEPKHIGAFPVVNHINLVMSSNEDWVVPAGEDERRFCVIEVSDARKNDHDYFAAIQKEADHGGIEAMLYDLLRWNLSVVNLRAFPKTDALMDQKLRNLGTVARFWMDCLQTGTVPLANSNREVNYIDRFDDHLPEKRELYDGYLAFCQNRRINHPSDLGHFFKALKEYCPGIKDHRPRVNGTLQARQLEIPGLGVCRRDMEQRLGGKIDWDDAVNDPAEEQLIPF